MGDWIVEQIREKEKKPGSRAVRREAAKFCRANGYEVRNDEWLGVWSVGRSVERGLFVRAFGSVGVGGRDRDRPVAVHGNLDFADGERDRDVPVRATPNPGERVEGVRSTDS